MMMFSTGKIQSNSVGEECSVVLGILLLRAHRIPLTDLCNPTELLKDERHRLLLVFSLENYIFNKN